MLEQFLEGVTRLVRTHQKWLLAVIGLLTLTAALGLRRLQADPSPRALLASADLRQEQIAAHFRKSFGSTDNVIAVVLEAPKDVLTGPALGYLYVLGEHFIKEPHVERFESVTRVPFPKPKQAAEDEELTLDSLDDAQKPDPAADDPKLLSALSDVVAAAPDVFPMGLASLAEKTGGAQERAPLITSEHPSDAEVAALKQAVADTPQLKGRLVSKDGRYALAAIVLDDALTKHEELDRAVENVRSFIAQHPAPKNVTVHLAGLPVLRTTIVHNMRNDQRLLTPATLVVSLFMLLLAFRWWAGVVLPLVKVGLTSLWVLGGMALFGVKLNVINNILPALLIIMGLSDSIHLVSRYMQEVARTREAGSSLTTTITSIGTACFGTASTTAAGLFALYVSKTRMLAEFGVVGGLGVMLAYFDTVVFLPAMLLSFTPPMKEARAELDEAKKRSLMDTILPMVTLRILRHPWLVLIVSMALTVFVTVVSFDLRVDSALLDQFKRDDPMYQTTRMLEDHFEGVRPLEVSLSSEQAGRFYEPEVLKALARVSAWTQAQAGVISATDPSFVLSSAWATVSGSAGKVEDALRTKEQIEGMAYVLGKQKPSPLAMLMTSDGKHARLRVRLKDTGSRATLSLVRGLEQKLAQELKSLKDVSYELTGDAYLSSHGLDAVVNDLAGNLGTAVVTILLLVFFSFRSWRYAVLLIPPNVIPMVLVMAWMVWRNIPLNAATAIIFSVSIGITVDAGIHLLARLREELFEGYLLTTAVMRAVRGTGSAIVLACVTLVLGFSALLLSQFVPVQRFAELIAVSIASCLVSTLVVLPALLAVVGRRFVEPRMTEEAKALAAE